MVDLLNELNDKQLEAVKATEGYVRVIAGVGSGKTKLLVSRYAYLATSSTFANWATTNEIKIFSVLCFATRASKVG